MDFAFDAEQQELRATARAFLADHAASEQRRAAMASETGFDAGLWKRIGAELGWPAIVVPEAYGGLGLGWVELVALLEVMGESLLCAPFFSSVCLGGSALLVAGSEAQKQAHLPGIAEGATLATLAWQGPGRDPGPGGMALRARRDGGDFRLSGAARHVLDGHCADLVVAAARAEEGGVSLFALPADTPGLSRRALPTLDPTRRLAELVFSDVRVPGAALLGEAGRGAEAFERVLDLARVALAAEQVGGAQRCLDLSVAYAKERVQFGRPIGSFQAIKHTCADMLVAVESARSAVYYAGCIAAEGGDELPVLASLAQATASDAGFRCAADAIQIHGGVGFTWEYDVHLYFKRARANEAFLGDPAWHRERVARAIGL